MTPSQLSVVVKYVPVLNLSHNHIVPVSQTTLLRKGLNFIPTSLSKDERVTQTLQKTFQKLDHTVKWSYCFKGSSPQGKVNMKLLAPSKAELPKIPSDLERFLHACKSQALKNVFTPILRPRFNYTTPDYRNFLALCNHKEVGIYYADKGLGPVFLPKSWHTKEGLRQLNDSKPTYAQKTEADFLVHAQNIMDFLIRNSNQFDIYLAEREKEGLFEFTKKAIQNRNIPLFKLLPKIHKLDDLSNLVKVLDELKGRPVVGGHSCPTAYLSSWVHSELQPYVSKAPQVLKDSKDLVAFLQDFDPQCPYVIATGDIVSLYPSIPIDFALNLIEGFLLSHGMDPQRCMLVIEAARVVLKNNFFEFEGTFWLQLIGTAMGTQCGPSFANLFLICIEKELSLEHVLFFKRFLDDLLIATLFLEAALRFFNEYNDLNDNIVVTSQIGPKQDYLCLTLFQSHEGGKIEHRTFAKPHNKFMYLPFSSAHPIHMKKAFIKGLLIALVINSSRFSFYLEDVLKCYNRLRARGYPASLLDPIVISTKYADRQSWVTREKIPPPSGLTFLSLPFNLSFAKLNLPKVFRDNWSLIEANQELSSIFSRPPLLSWQRTSNVSDIINKCKKAQQ